MDYSFRSSDAYYRDNKPETNFKVTPTPVYRQSSDINSSNNKYYAEMQVSAKTDDDIIAKLQMPPKKEVELEILDSCYGLSVIQEAIGNGATFVLVNAPEHIISQLRTAVDMAVGRNEITRQQADSVVFAKLPQSTVFVPPEVSVVQEEVATPTESIPEAAAILNDAPKQTRKKTKRNKSEEITIKDIEAAFNPDDSDD
jgi:superfamily I DNA and RNA helicase